MDNSSVTEVMPFRPRPTSTRAARRRRAGSQGTGGFTLIEVMITVAIIAIIAAVALPSYTDYITRSKIIDATSSLSDMRVRLEQYFQDVRQYPAACIALAAGPAPAGNLYLPASKHFTVACALTATTYTVTASGNAGAGMGGFVYTIDQANNRATTGLPSGWSGTGNTCWVIRKNGDC